MMPLHTYVGKISQKFTIGLIKTEGTLKTNQIFLGADSSRPTQQKKRMLRSVNCV